MKKVAQSGNPQRVIPLTLVVLVTIVTATAFLLSSANQIPNEHKGIDFTLPPSSLGRLVTLGEAQQSANFKVIAPSSLPTGTVLSKVFISNDNVVRLFYNNSKLSDAHAFGSSLPIPSPIVIVEDAASTNPLSLSSQQSSLPAITVQVKGPGSPARIAQVIPQQSVGTNVNVCGGIGFGRDPSSNDSGIITWWTNGVQYTIAASLPLTTLQGIASSMC